MTATQNLRGELRRMERTQLWAQLGVLALCLLYSVLSTGWGSGITGPLMLLVAFSLVPASLFSEPWMDRTLRPLRGLAARESVTADELATYVPPLFRLPQASFRTNLVRWINSGLLVWAGLWILSSVGPGRAFRICWPAFLFTPLASLLGFIITTLGARRVLRALTQLGLSAEQVRAAAPPTKAQLPRQLVIFIAVAVVTPVLMMVDLSGVLSLPGVDGVLAAADHARQLELVSGIERLRIAATIGFAVVMFVVALAASTLVGTALSEPLQDIADEVEALARGKVTKAPVIPAEDEVWSVASAFTAVQQHVSQVLAQLQAAGAQIGSSSEQLVGASVRYRERASEQASALQETSATTEELAQSARQISERASAVADLSTDTFEAAQAGLSGAQSFAQAMEKMRKSNAAIARALGTLAIRVRQIARSVEFIKQVADKSDLLALSAELEATKAGELGQGFSLVAGEVRRLAENVIRSTNDIERLIDEVSAATNAAVAVTSAGLSTTGRGADLAKSVADRLSAITELAGRTAEAVRTITAATREQEFGTEQLAAAMSEILRVTETSSVAASEVSSANAGLTEITARLQRTVGRFELNLGPRRREGGRDGVAEA